MDSILIRGLELDVLIGVHRHEREAAQTLRLDLRLDFDAAPAAASDALADTIDYAELSALLREHAQRTRHQLLERLGSELVELLMQRYAPRRLELSIDKPLAARALGCAAVGIVLRRGGPWP